MNTQQEFKDDPIRQYFNPEMVENAPSGFTEKVMSQVSLQARPLKAASSQRQKSYVPVISLAVIIILTAIAFTFPSAGIELAPLSWIKIFHTIELPSFKINLDSVLRFKLPGYLPYLIISILFLSIFDRALNGIFHRDKKDQVPKS
jgi:hypothetical protein